MEGFVIRRFATLQQHTIIEIIIREHKTRYPLLEWVGFDSTKVMG